MMSPSSDEVTFILREQKNRLLFSWFWKNLTTFAAIFTKRRK